MYEIVAKPGRRLQSIADLGLPVYTQIVQSAFNRNCVHSFVDQRSCSVKRVADILPLLNDFHRSQQNNTFCKRETPSNIQKISDS